MVTVDSGRVLLLRYILNNTSPGDAKLHLFKNDINPSKTDTLENYIESEAGERVLAGNGWSFSVSDDQVLASYPAQTFTVFDPVYGWYLTNICDGEQKLIWAERFPSQCRGEINIIPEVGLQ